MKMAFAALLFAFAGASYAAQPEASLQQLSPGPRFTAKVAGAPDAPQADTLIFDSFTGATVYTTTTGSPRTFMGAPINLAGAGGANPTISKITVYLAYTGAAAATYNSLRINIQLWDSWASANNPVFSNALGGVLSADVTGPVTLNPNTFSPIDIALGAPVTFTGLTAHGVAVNFQGDTGSGLASADALTALLRAGTSPIAVGSSALADTSYGYRNAAGQTTFNFAPSDLRGFAGQVNQGTVFMIYSSTTPVSLQSYSVD